MTNETAIHNLFALKLRTKVLSDREALGMGIKSLEALDKLESIIVEQLDKSDDQKECMTLRWVLDKIAEVDADER